MLCMELTYDPIWDESGELRRGCTVREALAWLTRFGGRTAGEPVTVNGAVYKIGRLLYGPERPDVADKPIAFVCDGYYQIAQRILTKIRGPEEQLKGIFLSDAQKPNVLTTLLDSFSDISSFDRSRKIIEQKENELNTYGYCL